MRRGVAITQQQQRSTHFNVDQNNQQQHRTTCTIATPFIALSPSSLLSIINYGGSKQENQNLRLKLKKYRRFWLRAVFACPHYHGEGISDNWYAINERRRDQGASNERWVDNTNCSFFLYHLCLLHLLISHFRFYYLQRPLLVLLHTRSPGGSNRSQGSRLISGQ